jgi:hypothetical protein
MLNQRVCMDMNTRLTKAGEQRMPQATKRVQRERRWIVLAEDGRHSTLGRDTDPSEDEIKAAERSLVAQALNGWLAVAEGDYWSRRAKVSLLMVRCLGAPHVEFDSAAAIFETLRRR